MGVPLSPVTLKVADYGGLINRVRARICNWKSKFLSFGGRKQLIISVLQSLQLYWMAIFLFPSAVIHELEAVCRDFLWAQGDSSKGKCRIAWDSVCRPSMSGGLGIKRLSVWNRALISKHIWDLITHRNSLWVTWISRQYLHSTSLWNIRQRYKWSWVFRKILTLRDHIRRFIKVQIGDGCSTNAWEDTWLSVGPLSSIVPYRYIHAVGFTTDSTVYDFLSMHNGVWPNEWLTRYPHLNSISLPSLIPNRRDMICWDVNRNGEFSVREA